MLNRELLEKLDFETQDIEYIIKSDEKYGKKIGELSKKFMIAEKDIWQKWQLSKEFLKKAVQTFPKCDNEYIIQLLFWLYCVPIAAEYYEKNNIRAEVFFDTMKDLSCKTRECKEMHNKVGTCSPWFFLHFGYVYFALGRLQYWVETYNRDAYSKCGYQINPGDRIYSCHIPSGSKLTEQKCMESFHLAYEFFKDELKDDILPLICTSWLLYPPYVESVFPKKSNMEKFASLFDIVGQKDLGRTFGECEKIFNVPFNGSTDGFPCDNSLRRNMIEYMNSGALSGVGIGIILYDGKKRTIL